jgi:DNA-binding MarR family transcriptional regulator
VEGVKTRWLSDREQQAWRSYLDSTRILTDALDRQLQADAGLSLSDYEILVRLSEVPERRLRMTELAGATSYSKSRLSHAVARLEGAGWVVRTMCEEDGRGTFAELTAAGLDKLRQAAPGHVAAVRRHLFDKLDGEQVEHLRALSAALASPASDPAGS